MLMLFIDVFFVLPAFCMDIKNSSLDFNYTTTPESVHFLNLDMTILCKFQPNGFDCAESGMLYHKYYYDLKLQDCKATIVGDCAYNLNTFQTLSDCHTSCRDYGTLPVPKDLAPRIFCRLQPDFGHCNDYHPRWYFDMTARRCRGFSFSGCGGNLNRFQSQQSCTTMCSGATERNTDVQN